VTSSVKGAIRGTNQVTIHLLEKDGQTLAPRASAPQKTAILPALTFGPEKGLRELLIMDKPRVVNTSVIEAYSQDPVTRNGTTDVVIASLVAGQETIGMLTLAPEDSSQTELLDEDKERLLGTLANQAAIAIKNAQLFEATQQAYEELRQLDDLKTEFINIAAHELRTPLGAMMGYASFAQKRVPDKLQKTMDFLVASTLRMRTMVDAMLTIQRLDAGTSFVRLRSVNIQDIFRKTLADFQLMAELQGHIVSTDFPDELPPIQADPEKIDLIFSNLLSNAIKFTPENGRIEITIQDYEESVLVSVCDNGVGIAEEEHERIFDRFYQVPVEHIAGHGGMGIGLTTVKHLIELHGGKIWLESKVGQGSTFFVELPKTVLVESSDTPTPVTVPLVETGTLTVQE
jgi:signal transduction histidine kinase